MAPGRIGIVASSDALARNVERQLPAFGLGASKVVCPSSHPGGRVPHLDILKMFQRHWGTDAVLLLGAIEPGEEQACAAWIARQMTKPVICYIEDNGLGSAAQRELLRGCGVHMGQDAASLGQLTASLVDCPWLPFD